MKKCIALVIGLFLGMFFVSHCYAAGNADKYEVTILKIEFKETNGTWLTVSEPNQTVDIANVISGATAASLVGSIPVGSYINFKLVLSETITFSGVDDSPADLSLGYTTVDGGGVTMTGDNSAAASTETWDTPPDTDLTDGLPDATMTETGETCAPGIGVPGDITATLNLDAEDADNYIEISGRTDLTVANAITVTENSTTSISFDFDTQGTVMWTDDGDGNVIIFLPPQEGTELIITVDGTPTTIQEANMKIDF
ncbi:DUF4382 domain-containing protein [Candidatus Omnitrophota bacterium]